MKTVIITGASAGIGHAAGSALAAQPDWHVVLACRNEAKASSVLREIEQTHPGAQVSVAPLDLFSLASVRALPARLTQMELPPIHGLILNAGGINMKAKALEFTEDGFERTFQLNFLGHFLLANLMMDHLAPTARVIFVSSDLHDPAATKMGKFAPPCYGPVEDLAYGRGSAAKLRPMARYGTAKLYTMMTAYELARRMKDSNGDSGGITVNSWSPGVIPTTQASRDMPFLLKTFIMRRWFVSFMGSHLSTEAEAALALGKLLISPEYAGVSGRYFDGFNEIPSSVESRDQTKARAVWEQAMALAGLAPGGIAPRAETVPR
jgi:NAD(P)-dependent dehydrogenase (short-subunit alcohol dehydrogenase family)